MSTPNLNYLLSRQGLILEQQRNRAWTQVAKAAASMLPDFFPSLENLRNVHLSHVEEALSVAAAYPETNAFRVRLESAWENYQEVVEMQREHAANRAEQQALADEDAMWELRREQEERESQEWHEQEQERQFRADFEVWRKERIEDGYDPEECTEEAYSDSLLPEYA